MIPFDPGEDPDRPGWYDVPEYITGGLWHRHTAFWRTYGVYAAEAPFSQSDYETSPGITRAALNDSIHDYNTEHNANLPDFPGGYATVSAYDPWTGFTRLTETEIMNLPNDAAVAYALILNGATALLTWQQHLLAWWGTIYRQVDRNRRGNKTGKNQYT